MNADSAFRGGAERSNAGPGGESADGWGRVAAYDAYADGLHTYALWSLRDHDAAVDALYCAFVIADRNVTQLRQPDLIQPWLYAILRSECAARTAGTGPAPAPVSGRRLPTSGAAELDGSLARLERSLRRAEFHSLEWPESEGLTPGHQEILELTIRHGLDSRGLGLVLGLNQGGLRDSSGQPGGARYGAVSSGPVGAQGFGVLADAWRELERSLAAVAVAKGLRDARLADGDDRGHCAQLAELIFGWSGRLNAALRGPLTDHVDTCSRCQNYLHTVVGTPAAPTILPFVAAPRTLREVLLAELNSPEAATRLGIDHLAIAARAARFTPEGFPALGGAHQARRTAHRRVPKRGAGRIGRGASGAESAAAEATGTATGPTTQQGGTSPLTSPPFPSPPPTGPQLWTPLPGDPAPSAPPMAGVPFTSASPTAPNPSPPNSSSPTPPHNPLLLRRPVAPGPPLHVVNPPTPPEHSGVYRAPGSWADRVLPAEPAQAAPGHIPGTNEPAYVQPGRSGTNGRPRPQFVDTASGRFAAAVPLPRAGGPAFAAVAEPPAPRTQGQRIAAQRAPGQRTPAARTRARHKSRPVRQAVLSAMALGAVGAVAAASAAVLGLTSSDHPSQALGGSVVDPVVPGSTSGSGGPALAVTGSPTAPAPGGSGAADPAQGSDTPTVTGSVITTTAPAGSAPTQSANPAANFYISVNQRSADPDSVSILLRNSGTAAISWSARPQDSWITLSQSSGTLAGGASLTITADASSAAPAGQWTSQVAFAPGNQVVVLHGGIPTAPPTTPPSTPPTTTTTPPPSTPAPPTASPTPSATAPAGGTPSTTPPAAPSATPSSTAPRSPGPTPTGHRRK